MGLLVCLQRLLLLATLFLIGGWHVLRFQDSARFMAQRLAALEYLQEHDVSAEMQIEVAHGLHETQQVTRCQNHFLELPTANIPGELRCRICEELWTGRLLSLGLVSRLATNHDQFARLLVHKIEEAVFASRSVVFAEGDRCSAAYLLLQGAVDIW